MVVAARLSGSSPTAAAIRDAMPELPEVEAARRRAARALVGWRIARVHTTDDGLVYAGVSPRRFARALAGRLVLAVGRKGKHLWIELDERPWPLFHFGMTGSFEIYRSEQARPRFSRVELLMENGTRLAMADPRRFGRIRLRQSPREEAPVAELGFDALEGLPPAPELRRLMLRRRAPIKAVLLDQSLFAGVGNWIADEVLFQSRLGPRRRADALALGEVARLRRRLIGIIRRAVAVGADSDRFPRGWLFHRRWGKDESARTLRGEKIVHETIAGRTTAFVPSRQR